MRARRTESGWVVGMMKFWFWWTVVLPIFLGIATVAVVLAWAAVKTWIDMQ